MVRNLVTLLLTPINCDHTVLWFGITPFDSNREPCVETEGGNTIDLIANGTNIGFDSRTPTENEFQIAGSCSPNIKVLVEPQDGLARRS